MSLQEELHTGCGQIGNADVAILQVKISSSVLTLTGVITADSGFSVGN